MPKKSAETILNKLLTTNGNEVVSAIKPLAKMNGKIFLVFWSHSNNGNLCYIDRCIWSEFDGRSFFSPHHNTYGWDLPILSLAVSLNMITWGIFHPVMGKMIDRFGPKLDISSSETLMRIAFILSATITELWQFFFYYSVLTAIGFAGCGSMGMNIISLLLLPLTVALVSCGKD